MAPPILELLDTASLYFRAFYGVPATLTAPDGRPVNAVRGLLDAIALFVERYRPTHLACCWDNDWRPAWRVDLLPSYKAHRVAYGDVEEVPDALTAQVPVIREVLDALGLAVVGQDEYEADDVIGTLAQTPGFDVLVVTGDRDLFQLVGGPVRVAYLARGIRNHELVDDAWLRAKYGIDGSAYADLAVLRGDPSDGLPGVTGIGEKGATRLLSDYGDLEGIVAAAGAGRLSPRITAGLTAAMDYLGAAREVVGVRRDLDLGIGPEALVLPAVPRDASRFAELAERYGLGGSADRVVAALAGQTSATRT